MPERIRIDEKEVNRIFELEEGPYVDLKDSAIAPGKLSKSVSAFANTAGGELFIGIAETQTSGLKRRAWSGFKDLEATNSIFQVLEAIYPAGGHYKATYYTQESASTIVLHIVVFKTQDVVKATDNVPYVRRAAQNLPVNTLEGLKRLQLDKGIVSFEDHTIGVDVRDITNSVNVLKFMLSTVPTAEPSGWLTKQNLTIDGKPTVAGLLLFSDEPQAALPKRSAIKIYRYQTREEEGTRDTLAFNPLTIEGNTYDQIKTTVLRTKEVIENISKLGETGLEKIRYPDETLHEIITNAVLHRDYSLASDVHVRIYNNRIEVESPGRLPGHVTKDNILSEQSARNPKIVRLINKFPDPPNKDVGEGLNTAFEAMKKLKLQPPEVEEKEHSVVVHIRHAPLASTHDVIMGYLKNHSEIRNSIVRDLTGIGSENVVKQAFLDLAARRLIERVPGKRGSASAWRLYTGTTQTDDEESVDLGELDL
jgi:ATP-dependent DNA helicase RecG